MPTVVLITDAAGTQTTWRCEKLCGFEAALKTPVVLHELTCMYTGDVCGKCGGKLSRGPFMSVCLACEPQYARRCVICGAPRWGCCC